MTEKVPSALDKIADIVLKYRPPAKDEKLTAKAKLVEENKKDKVTKIDTI